ncbi:QsdR family transcriptional regulator [Amycolatopsis albispora]|uniref:QsdR family transcriptional regulator n=1 Tax=Amycolatopsis albispora TaxID=1804986 RepID=UPI001EEF3DD1|nr:QsdR family transcriptional regulator [Amycolatopsis albispora]
MVSTKPDVTDAFQLARQWFLAGRRIDMQELAAELKVGRATLFRWVGNREQLLGEVIWSITERTFDRHNRAVGGSGGARIAEVVGTYVRTVNNDGPFRAFLRREPERALRLLTTKASLVQRRTIAAVESMLTEEIDRGALEPPLPVHDLAYLIVRIAESFIYTDIISGEEPDADKAREAVAALLR